MKGRKKLQRKFDVFPSTAISQEASRVISEPDDAASFVQVEAPPWAENYDLNDNDSKFHTPRLFDID